MIADPIDEITSNDSVSDSGEPEHPMDAGNCDSQTGVISADSIESSVDIFRKKCQECRFREDELKRVVDAYRSLLLMNAEHQSYLIAVDSVKDLLAQNYPSVFHLVGFIAGIHEYVDKWKNTGDKCRKTLVEFSSFISDLELNDATKALNELETCQTRLKEAVVAFQNAIVVEEEKQTKLRENLMNKVAAVNAQIDANNLARDRVAKNTKEISGLEECNKKLREAVSLKKNHYRELESSVCKLKEKNEEVQQTISEKKNELEMKRKNLSENKGKLDEFRKRRQDREDRLNRIRSEYKQLLNAAAKEYNEIIQQHSSKIATEDSTATERQNEEESLTSELRKLTKELEGNKMLKEKLMKQKEDLSFEIAEIKKKNALLLARQMEEAAKKEEERKAAEALAEKKRIQKEKRLAKKKEKETSASQQGIISSKSQESASNPLEESFFESQGSDSDYEALAKMKRRGRKKATPKTPAKNVDEKVSCEVKPSRPKRQSAQTALQRTKSYLAEDEDDEDIDALITSVIVSSNDIPLASSTDEATSSPKKRVEFAQAVDIKHTTLSKVEDAQLKTPEKSESTPKGLSFEKSESSGSKTPKKLPVVEKPTASQVLKAMATPVKKQTQCIDTPRPGNIPKNPATGTKKSLQNPSKTPDPADSDVTNQSFWDF